MNGASSSGGGSNANNSTSGAPSGALPTSEWVDLLGNMSVLPPRNGDQRPLSGDEWASVGLYSAIVLQRAMA